MRHTEFWFRMDDALGEAYAPTWAREHVLSGLGERTVVQALDDGWDARTIWREVWSTLGLPDRDR